MRAGMGVVVLGLVLCAASRAGAEESSPCGAKASDAQAEAQSFGQAYARFVRLWQLTQSLVVERERHAFESSAAQYERFAALTRELAERHAAEEAQAFEQSVTLYLRKREVTQALTAAHASRDAR